MSFNLPTDDARPTSLSTTLATSLTAQLRHAIVSGQLAPGARLSLVQLREEFGVSLSPLREALSRLSSEGLILIEDQRGYRVPPMSEEDQTHVTRMRSEFEIFALREAIAKGDLEWESKVTAALYILNKTERKTKTGFDDWERAHREFHLTLISACRMPLLLQFCSVLHDHSDRYRRVYLIHSEEKANTTEHKAITEAALARKADLACRLLEKHIARAGANARKAVHIAAQKASK
ncbi:MULTISPECIES: GntR family transcriptional regulator [unclassified Beijerinckia]|uniref:GntR family transcriptional regulator n=1 Tax=unclassified Beijerinckia TaxID=2638183 RepID=UPI00089CE59E|nr:MULTISPECIES: GntR family transcriptional regulator [unclassified Beijerinckia]MDH7796023.1 GntR family carbon starvation induced transcriptional regulator [Beijerinckia sp. GAS462]SEC26874.1 DNA-binding transcriptional regulator, GntR family [Beijerinckia sp. 28-YEA-48]